MRTPEKAIFDKCFLLCEKVSDKVYWYLPNSETKYPFINLSRTSNTNINNNDLLGEVTQTINLWGTEKELAIIDNLNYRIRDLLHKEREAFEYSIRLIDYNTITMVDTSTGEPLLHTVIEVTYNYTRKE